MATPRLRRGALRDTACDLGILRIRADVVDLGPLAGSAALRTDADLYDRAVDPQIDAIRAKTRLPRRRRRQVLAARSRQIEERQELKQRVEALLDLVRDAARLEATARKDRLQALGAGARGVEIEMLEACGPEHLLVDLARRASDGQRGRRQQRQRAHRIAPHARHLSVHCHAESISHSTSTLVAVNANSSASTSSAVPAMATKSVMTPSKVR